ncbi:MAG: hypothetical protein ACXVJ0_17165, partial [Candidatus Angelobacter sp.]
VFVQPLHSKDNAACAFVVETATEAVIIPLVDSLSSGESLPIQDEPEGEVSFQFKMSLEWVAC